jgi:hypothetical protein
VPCIVAHGVFDAVSLIVMPFAVEGCADCRRRSGGL